MSEILQKAIEGVTRSTAAFCRFITANDTGYTGSHQSGFYIPKCASPLLFDKPGIKGENKEKAVEIKWQDSFTTQSRMKYYGQGSRNEYRITRFGKNFEFINDDHIGDLIILAKLDESDYLGYVLSTEEDIEGFMMTFGLAPGATNQLIDATGGLEPSSKLTALFQQIAENTMTFPTTTEMAKLVRECHTQAFRITDDYLLSHSDEILTSWVDAEYKLFEILEDKFFLDKVNAGFPNVKAFTQLANEIINRRKSRAGKSLEKHLASIFEMNHLVFEEQAVTEDNKKPDFIFPNGKCYHDFRFPAEDLTILGAKTTCKDRWRQVLTEADRVDTKYLFTLQQGISSNQMQEMTDSHLILVVPEHHKTMFPEKFRSTIQSLREFIATVSERQNRTPRHFLM